VSNLEEKYSKIYSSDKLGNYDIELFKWPRDRFQALIFCAGKGDTVLDIGCGNGLVLYNLRNNSNFVPVKVLPNLENSIL
jgi:ubiquinone/menaquinone biosynthesis C-methylase UbiE